MRGPLDESQSGGSHQVRARRYRCSGCRGILTVVPREVLYRRHFAASAIGLAIALVGLLGQSFGSARQRVAGTTGSRSGWITVERWGARLQAGTLVPRLGPLSGRPFERAAALLRDMTAGREPRGSPAGLVAEGAVLAAHAC